MRSSTMEVGRGGRADDLVVPRPENQFNGSIVPTGPQRLAGPPDRLLDLMFV